MNATITSSVEREALLPLGRVRVPGILSIPADAKGLVLFAHGSGSGRLSPRNQLVATELRRAGLGTLLFDMLTEDEAKERANVFDIPLLAERLLAATTWARSQPECAELPLGYFGASTGAAAALVAVAQSRTAIGAIVSRGGRPDLAGAYLREVKVPTLLIVGGLDEPVIGLNHLALDQLGGFKRLVIIPGARHLFEEPGKLEVVAAKAAEWFAQHLGHAQKTTVS